MRVVVALLGRVDTRGVTVGIRARLCISGVKCSILVFLVTSKKNRNMWLKQIKN